MAKRSARPPASPTPETPVQPAPSVKIGKNAAKTVRDSLNMPREDFALLDRLKEAARSAGRPTKKNELIRAGLHGLASLKTEALLDALAGLPAVAKGRPKHPSE